MLVPLFLPGIPCARRPISLPNEYPHSSLYCGRLIKCLYSSNSPVSASSTDPAKSVRNSSLKLLLAAWRGVGQLHDISVALSNCCRLPDDLLTVLAMGSSSSIRVGPPLTWYVICALLEDLTSLSASSASSGLTHTPCSSFYSVVSF